MPEAACARVRLHRHNSRHASATAPRHNGPSALLLGSGAHGTRRSGTRWRQRGLASRVRSAQPGALSGAGGSTSSLLTPGHSSEPGALSCAGSNAASPIGSSMSPPKQRCQPPRRLPRAKAAHMRLVVCRMRHARHRMVRQDPAKWQSAETLALAPPGLLGWNGLTLDRALALPELLL